jgi:hypothetical protein
MKCTLSTSTLRKLDIQGFEGVEGERLAPRPPSPQARLGHLAAPHFR